MSKIVFGMLCPYCKTPLTENDSIVVCSSCEMPHHLNCWQENKGCTTFGCTGTVGETFEGKDNGPLNNEVPSAVQTGNAGMLQRLHEGDKSTVWKKGAIAVDKTSLWINRELGQVYASCELRNIGEVQINAVMIEVQCKDIWGSVLDSTVAYQFLDLSVRRGDVFGHNEYIALSDKNTRNITVSIKKVLLADGTMIDGHDDCVTMPAPVMLDKYLQSNALAEEFARNTTALAKYVPVIAEEYWRCTCGMICSGDQMQCPICGSEREAICSTLDAEKLRESMIAHQTAIRIAEEKKRAEEEERVRHAQEQAERERSKKEHEIAVAEKEAKKKRQRKRTIRALIALAILIPLLTCGTIFFGIPYYHYVNACKLLEELNFDEAHQAFVDLDGFLNSEEFALESLYRKAYSLAKDGKYDDAMKLYEELGDYKESAEKLKEVTYSRAESRLSGGKYDAAIEDYTSLGNYKDCVEKITLTKYKKANALLADKKYDEAYLLFIELGKYEDSAKLVDTCITDWTSYLLKSGTNADAKKFKDTVKLESNQNSIVYNKIMAALRGNKDPGYWVGNHGHAAYALLQTLPKNYSDTENLLKLFEALRYGDLESGSYVRYNMSFIREMWNYDVVKNAMESDYAIIDFLVGDWYTKNKSYYIKFTYNNGHNSRYNLPWVSEPRGTKYFNIENMTYVYENDAGKNLADVYKFTIKGVDTIEVYCYKNRNTYTLYRK